MTHETRVMGVVDRALAARSAVQARRADVQADLDAVSARIDARADVRYQLDDLAGGRARAKAGAIYRARWTPRALAAWWESI